MRHYETIYIVNPDLGDEEYKAEVEKFNSLITDLKGVVVKTQEWGKQRLAYLVKKFDRGSYVLVEYCGDAGTSDELETNLKLDDKILKFQTVKLADEVDVEALVAAEQEKEAAKEAAATATAATATATETVATETVTETAATEAKEETPAQDAGGEA